MCLLCGFIRLHALVFFTATAINADVSASSTPLWILVKVWVITVLLMSVYQMQIVKFAHNIWIISSFCIIVICLLLHLVMSAVQANLAILLVGAGFQIFLLIFLMKWHLNNNKRIQLAYVNRSVLEQLENILGVSYLKVYEWLRATSGILFLIWVMITGFLLLLNDYLTDETKLSDLINMAYVLFGILVFVTSFTLLSSATVTQITRRPIGVKNIVFLVLKLYPIGIVLYIFVIYLIVTWVLHSDIFWLLSIIAITLWSIVCALWAFYLLRVVARVKGSDYFQRIEEIRAKYQREIENK
jgi:hypothetical protein